MSVANVLPLLGLFDNSSYSRRAAKALAAMAAEGSRSQAVLDFLLPWLAYLRLRPIPERIEWAWRNLPTRYVADRDGDNWQPAWQTLARGAGDCEDWAVVLCAILKALGITASVGVMPGHAAVFVPLVTTSWLFPASNPDVLPDNWRVVTDAGRKYLALEATTNPSQRGVPGSADELIRPWLDTNQLWICQA